MLSYRLCVYVLYIFSIEFIFFAHTHIQSSKTYCENRWVNNNGSSSSNNKKQSEVHAKIVNRVDSEKCASHWYASKHICMYVCISHFYLGLSLTVQAIVLDIHFARFYFFSSVQTLFKPFFAPQSLSFTCWLCTPSHCILTILCIYLFILSLSLFFWMFKALCHIQVFANYISFYRWTYWVTIVHAV